MKKWLTVSLMILGITLLPSSLRAPSTAGQTATQPVATTEAQTITEPTVNAVPTLKLGMPFSTPSHWASGDTAQPGIWWETNAGAKYFVIQDGQFISTDPSDTWFVYGWFGSLAAIKESYNIKYPEWGDRHNGIDFAGREGIDVISATEGIVTFIGDKIGNTVIVKTGDYQITYGHLQDINVRAGQTILAGELIGHLGKTGTTNPHLHFQLDYIKDGLRMATNPAPLFDTDWAAVIIPNAPSNSFYAGPTDPLSQPNFTW